MPGWTTQVYVRDQNNSYGDSGRSDLIVTQVGAERARLMEPINALSADRFRVDVLIINRTVQQRILEKPNEVHILLSFGVPQNGFIAQQVATSLGLKHISCFRGTDFSRDFFDPFAQTAINYVM